MKYINTAEQVINQCKEVIENYCNKNHPGLVTLIEIELIEPKYGNPHYFLNVYTINKQKNPVELFYLNQFLDAYWMNVENDGGFCDTISNTLSNGLDIQKLESFTEQIITKYKDSKLKTKNKNQNKDSLKTKLKELFEVSEIDLKISKDCLNATLVISNFKIHSYYFGNPNDEPLKYSCNSTIEVLNKFLCDNNELREYVLQSIKLMKKLEEAQKIIETFLLEINKK